MATLATITARVQALCNDQEVQVLTQTFLLPYINAMQEELTQRLRSAGVDRLRFSSVLDVPAGTTSITTASTPPLPTSPVLDEPDVLFEKDHGADDSTYREMIESQQLPDIPQQSALVYWNWDGGTINFVGATTERDVRVHYFGDLAALTDSTDTISIVGSNNALAFLTAAAVMLSRDVATAAQFQAKGNYYIDLLINEQIKVKQREPLRRRPMRSRARYQNRF